MIIIVGTGAVAAELTFFLKGIHLIKGYLEFDYNLEKYYNRYNYKAPVLGDIDNYEIQSDDQFVLGIANINFRKKVIRTLRGAKFINIIHPLALVSPDLELGEGNIITPYCIIDPKVKIGSFNLFTAQTAISHDCVIGDNNFISSSVICGHVRMGNDNFFGVHAAVIPELEIGSGNTIAAGVTLNRSITNDSIVYYDRKELIVKK
jgi:sugar O-acyltransferase (sialic acid O-acetyltransferase NeuD family)